MALYTLLLEIQHDVESEEPYDMTREAAALEGELRQYLYPLIRRGYKINLLSKYNLMNDIGNETNTT